MTSSVPFSTPPAGALQKPTPFEVHVNEKKLEDLKTLLRLSPLSKETYENLQDEGSHGDYGLSRKWMADAKSYWEEKFDWRKEESHINSFPNFKSEIKDDDSEVFDVHFAALFSSRKDAIPLAFFHGWPGSFLEFLPLMDILRKKYTPDTLPYHIIVPSLPGFGFSSPPPLSKDWKAMDTTRIMHKLLLSLGFGFTGYLVQGGDVGSIISRQLAATYKECKGMHLNLLLAPEMEHAQEGEDMSETERKGVERIKEFWMTGRAYAIMHGTRPATVGFALSSSPVALLAWIGEKFLAWSDPNATPPLDTILADITLYWLTNCFPTSIYTYRDRRETLQVDKPCGYSRFPWELAPASRAWVAKTMRLEFFRAHEKGGHFAALEVPELLLADVEEWVKIAWK